MRVIPLAIKKILDKWNIRGLVILSLLFQTSLIFLAPLRKRTPKKLLAAVLWTSYLLANWTANYAVAQITNNQGKEPERGDPPKNKKLLALWAPFLLLHLGATTGLHSGGRLVPLLTEAGAIAATTFA